MPVNVGSNPREVFANVDPDVVLTVLLHKIVATAAAEGASEGHALLQSWLAQLFAQYNLHVLGASSSPGVQVRSAPTINVTFCGTTSKMRALNGHETGYYRHEIGISRKLETGVKNNECHIQRF